MTFQLYLSFLFSTEHRKKRHNTDPSSTIHRLRLYVLTKGPVDQIDVTHPEVGKYRHNSFSLVIALSRIAHMYLL